MTTRHITSDHEQIRHWVQIHHGAPARVASTTSALGRNQLRIDFLGIRHPDLEHLDWHDWFAAFDAQSLALSYTDSHQPAVPDPWELVHRSR
ncbi:hypothetical protein P3H15_52610 [Rhodococcus sp. T2V]|uniref:hypothetical protein n=1 Tax=Rhodococcus sp. T2V TaxID=3034164 RepID=UPI0023E277F0|nr:hypothetical protein [Rhodococcus sp. T2V]MDF3313540.1 hypothetical protein [Rhodococcus sp. T2V]